MEPVYTFKSPDDFRRAFPRIAARKIQRAGEWAVGDLHARMFRELILLTPVGGIVSRDRHPGLMKRSWRASSGTGPKRIGVIINLAPHAQIIEGGRRRAQSYTSGKRTKQRRLGDFHARGQGKAASGKMLGSLQAPRGVVFPAWRRVQRYSDKVRRDAIAFAERKAA